MYLRLFILLLTISGGIFLQPARILSTSATPTIKACHICDEEVIPAPMATPTVAPEQSEAGMPVVRAVMFWSDSCPHCHHVLDEVLPPLQQQYREQFEILLVETSSPENTTLFLQTAETFGIPRERLGVPFLVIGDTVLIGSAQIPDELPGLIEKHLATGGLDYPNIPGLAPLLPVPLPEDTGSCVPETPCGEEAAPSEATATLDSALGLIGDLPAAPAPAAMQAEHTTPNGFGLAIAIMIGMVAALIFAAVVIVRGAKGHQPRPVPAWLDLAIPMLSIIGLGVATYLAYVETQAVSAVCGPVGDCNAVQASPYAKLFGVLPIGVLGAAGYIAILLAWLWWRFGAGRPADYAPLAIFGMAFFGVLFSLYLTYLEPFVIQAVCIWCLTSAVLITILMLLSLNPALQLYNRLDEERRRNEKNVIYPTG